MLAIEILMNLIASRARLPSFDRWGFDARQSFASITWSLTELGLVQSAPFLPASIHRVRLSAYGLGAPVRVAKWLQ